jgi:hypothetical protein
MRINANDGTLAPIGAPVAGAFQEAGITRLSFWLHCLPGCSCHPDHFRHLIHLFVTLGAAKDLLTASNQGWNQPTNQPEDQGALPEGVTSQAASGNKACMPNNTGLAGVIAPGGAQTQDRGQERR